MSPSLLSISQALRALSAKVRWLKCLFQKLVSASGWCEPGPIYAELLTRTRTGNTYSLMFLSIYKRDYRIEQSIDLEHWSVAGPDIRATSVTTTWTSPAVPAGVEVYFRIRLLPERQIYCYTATADGQGAPSAYCLFTDDIATLD